MSRLSATQSAPAASPQDDGHPWFEWPVLFVSWTLALADYRKKSRENADRTKVIVQMNRLYFIASILLVTIVVSASCNNIGSTQWGPANTTLWFRIPTFALASYCLSRCIEVFYAFLRDAFARLAVPEGRSDLDGRRRISLALASYAELILNFGILLSLVPKEAWQTKNANPPEHVTDVLFYSASTITTSGGGGFVPKGVVVQALTAFEIACGLILLVVCFAVYASTPTSKRDADGVSPGPGVDVA